MAKLRRRIEGQIRCRFDESPAARLDDDDDGFFNYPRNELVI
jgi:hypothetical protein